MRTFVYTEGDKCDTCRTAHFNKHNAKLHAKHLNTKSSNIGQKGYVKDHIPAVYYDLDDLEISCSHKDCQVRYKDKDAIEACSRSDCGKKQPRCPVCQAYFVTNLYDLCTGCLLDPTASCDNCGQQKTQLMRTDLDELWCFDCLQLYQEKGPALSFNKQAVNKDIEAKNKFYNQQIPRVPDLKTVSKCKSCKSSYVGPVGNNICVPCLRLMSKNLCTSCYARVDKDVGTDKEGKCIECSSNVQSKEYGYNDPNYELGLESTTFPMHKMFKDVDGNCTNCNSRRVMIGTQLCEDCYLLIRDLNKRFLDSLQDDIK